MSIPNLTIDNSKKITIHRKPGATQEQADLLAYYALTYHALGSYFEAGGSQKSASGLSYQEEAVLMPLLIDIPAEDKEFRRKVAIFNDEINTVIAHGTGKTLEIGLTVNNNAPMSAANLPLHPMDYLRYRHALRHPECGETKDAALGSMLKHYYIHDGNLESISEFSSLEIKDTALTAYLGIKKDVHKVEMHLSLLGVDTRGVAEKDQISILRKTVEEKPKEFLENVADKNNVERFFINNLLTAKIMEIVGSSYLIKETGENIGYSVEAAVEYLKNAANSQIKGVLKAKLQDVRKPSKKKLVETVNPDDIDLNTEVA